MNKLRILYSLMLLLLLMMIITRIVIIVNKGYSGYIKSLQLIDHNGLLILTIEMINYILFQWGILLVCVFVVVYVVVFVVFDSRSYCLLLMLLLLMVISVCIDVVVLIVTIANFFPYKILCQTFVHAIITITTPRHLLHQFLHLPLQLTNQILSLLLLRQQFVVKLFHWFVLLIYYPFQLLVLLFQLEDLLTQ